MIRDRRNKLTKRAHFAAKQIPFSFIKSDKSFDSRIKNGVELLVIPGGIPTRAKPDGTKRPDLIFPDDALLGQFVMQRVQALRSGISSISAVS